jgi:RNA ligase (TIGR02306 family)
MRHITAITPIPDADKIEAVHVDGWQVVDQKGNWREGDLCVFFEPDTAMPTTDSRYAHMAQYGVKDVLRNGAIIKAHVLRTRKFRGAYSQGYVARPSDVLPSSIPEHAYEQMAERRTDLTKLCGVCEYENPNVTLGSMGIIRSYDPWVAPRTNCERINNISDACFQTAKKTDYLVSVKVDGTSLTSLYDPRYNAVRLFSHNNELSITSGFGQRVYQQAERQGIIKFLCDNPGITLQFEGAGAKINGNRLGLKELRLFVFSAWDTQWCQYLDPYQLIWDFGEPELRQSLTPRLDIDLSDFATTDDLIEYVDGLRGNVTDRLDEGIVIHILGQGQAADEEWRMLQGALDAQMQIKVISRKYLLKAKE